jgi:hypothetical protein
MRLKNKFRTKMTQLNKFEDIYGRFSSLGSGMTLPNKFR